MNSLLNRNSVRDNNIKAIMNKLYDNPYSCKELANYVNISEVAVNKILKQLLSLNLIEYYKEDTTKRQSGGQHIRYKVNGNKGNYIFIDFAHYKDSYYIYDFSLNLLKEGKFDLGMTLTYKDIESSIETVRKEWKSLNLDNQQTFVVVSIPGQINICTQKFSFSGRFRKILDINLWQMCQNAFNAEVIIRNNVYLMSIGEMYENAEITANQNALICFAGRGIVFSVMHNGEIISSESGYFGEVGQSLCNNNLTYNETCSISGLLEKCKIYLTNPTDINELFELFQHNREVRDIVLDSGKILANTLIVICNATGIDNVIFTGEVTSFGTDYYETVKTQFEKYCNIPVKMDFKSNFTSALQGMKILARNNFIDILLKERYTNIDK